MSKNIKLTPDQEVHLQEARYSLKNAELLFSRVLSISGKSEELIEDHSRAVKRSLSGSATSCINAFYEARQLLDELFGEDDD